MRRGERQKVKNAVIKKKHIRLHIFFIRLNSVISNIIKIESGIKRRGRYVGYEINRPNSKNTDKGMYKTKTFKLSWC
jgi:hypothetical protein